MEQMERINTVRPSNVEFKQTRQTHLVCACPDPAIEVPDRVEGRRGPHLAVTRHRAHAGGILLICRDSDGARAVERQDRDDGIEEEGAVGEVVEERSIGEGVRVQDGPRRPVKPGSVGC